MMKDLVGVVGLFVVVVAWVVYHEVVIAVRFQELAKTDGLVVKSVQWNDWVDQQDLLMAVVNENCPVVINDAPIRAWPALAKWPNDQYLDELLTLVDVRKSSTGEFAHEELNDIVNMAIEEGMSTNFSEPLVDISVKAFLKAPEKTHLLYQRGLSDERLLRDIDGFDFSVDGGFLGRALWMGKAGIVELAHYLRTHNFVAQVQGSTKISLSSPSHWRTLKSHPSFHIRARQSQTLSEAETVSVTLEPGQVLYIPPYTIREIKALETSILVNHASMSLLRAIERELLSIKHIRPRPLESIFDENPQLFPGAVRVYIYEMVESVLKTCHQGEDGEEYGFAKAFLKDLIDARYMEMLTELQCDDWNSTRCPNIWETMSNDTMEKFRASIGEFVGVLNRQHCFFTKPVLGLFLGNWVEAVTGNNVGLTKICTYLRCIAL